jgi:high-affinity iron transporter
MFLNSVILVLQEILEAALLLSMLLLVVKLIESASQAAVVRRSWIWSALGCGVVFAWTYAWFMPVIAVWFDYVGQEVTNAFCQVITILFLLVFIYGIKKQGDPPDHRHALLASVCLIVVMALAIMREGSEIVLYINGIMGQPEAVTPVILGAILATGIGVSCGVLLYYAGVAINRSIALRIALVLLALFAGNMASQAVLLLTQADWLPFTIELWDSSNLLPEYSVTGQLLYALVGYEATPSLLQLLAYVAAFIMIALSPVFRSIWTGQERV